PENAGVLNRHVIRTFREFLVRAPGALAPDELRDFFDESRRVYAGIGPDAAAEHLMRASWALSFYALLADDFALFCDPESHRLGEETIDGQLHLALDRPVRPDLQPLLCIHPLADADGGAVSLTIEAATPTGRGRLELRGTVEAVNREHPYVPPVGFGLALEIGDTSVRSPISLGAALTPRKLAWTADVDPGQLPTGRHRLRISSAGWVAGRRAQVDVAEPLSAAGVELVATRARTGSYLNVPEQPKRGLGPVAARLRR
ncbi:MAG: hypothetical protein QOJ72_2656, partial [Nocardioidaceae bacterium]|nr:hypothetical protein [Nocardioidaceae bacterium]